MREALETMFSGLFAIVFGILWLQLFAAFWVPCGFAVLETELRWVICMGSCAACMLLPVGALLLVGGFVWAFAHLVHTRLLRLATAEPPIPRAWVSRGPGREGAVNALSCMNGVGRVRNL